MKKKEILNIEGLEIEVERKKIKNIYLRVYPPDARVHISAPNRLSISSIRDFAHSKLDWIINRMIIVLEREKKYQKEFREGEYHYLFGKKYYLNLIYENKSPKAEIIDNKINLYTKEESFLEERETILREFYRKELRNILPSLINKWEDIMNLEINLWDIRKMKTIWGSCNPSKKKIMFNLELAKKPIHCIEYIVVHELAHLIERSHNARFKSILDNYLPEWKELKKELN